MPYENDTGVVWRRGRMVTGRELASLDTVAPQEAAVAIDLWWVTVTVTDPKKDTSGAGRRGRPYQISGACGAGMQTVQWRWPQTCVVGGVTMWWSMGALACPALCSGAAGGWGAGGGRRGAHGDLMDHRHEQSNMLTLLDFLRYSLTYI